MNEKAGAIEKAVASGARSALSAAWEEGPNGVRGHALHDARAVAGRLLIDTVRRPVRPSGGAAESAPPGGPVS